MTDKVYDDAKKALSHPTEFVRRGVNRETNKQTLDNAKRIERQDRKALKDIAKKIQEDADTSSEEEQASGLGSFFSSTSTKKIKKLKSEETRAAERIRKIEEDKLISDRRFEKEISSAGNRLAAAKASLEYEQNANSGWTWWW